MMMAEESAVSDSPMTNGGEEEGRDATSETHRKKTSSPAMDGDSYTSNDDDDDSNDNDNNTNQEENGNVATAVDSGGFNTFDNDRLERYGRWLLSIPRDDVLVLRQTPEYVEFINAFERLGHAHRRAITLNRSRMQIDNGYCYHEYGRPCQEEEGDAEEGGGDDFHDDGESNNVGREGLKSSASTIEPMDEITSSSSPSPTTKTVKNASESPTKKNRIQTTTTTTTTTTGRETTRREVSSPQSSSCQSVATTATMPPASSSRRTTSSGSCSSCRTCGRTSYRHHRHHYYRLPSYSFLQHLADDDVVLRVFEFLECRSLTRTSVTCSRFRELATRSARQRTQHVMTIDDRRSSAVVTGRRTRGGSGGGNDNSSGAGGGACNEGGRILGSVMKMLRATEQIEGVDAMRGPFVRVPMLGLRRRVLVSNAGDSEYNGVYFCTGSNGNGFVFTKPRVPERRVGQQMKHAGGTGGGNGAENWGGDAVMSLAAGGDGGGDEDGGGIGGEVGGDGWNGNNGGFVNYEGEEAQPGQLLRCVIAKRFSNETILWYMSKEVEITTGSPECCGSATVGEVKQVFSFWAKLMVIGDATPDICRYPSQTSILSRNGDPAWQSLSSTRSTHPPTVELLD